MKMKFSFCVAWVVLAVSGITAELSYRAPADLAVWETFRTKIVHPAGLYSIEDVQLARTQIARHEWAAEIALKDIQSADNALKELSSEFLEKYIPALTPLAAYAPCPACRDKGLRWLPNGTWTRGERDDQLKCSTCGTIYPNERYPETISITSKWDPSQTFTYYGGEVFEGHGNSLIRPSFSGIIRTQLLHSALNRLHSLAFAYAYTLDPKYAEGARKILLRCAEVFPKYMFSSALYSEIADCSPLRAGEDPNHLPTDEITVPPNKPDRKLKAGYWTGTRLGSAGLDCYYLYYLLNAYDLTCEAQKTDGTPVYTDAERKLIEKNVLLEMSHHFLYDLSINNKSVGNRAAAALVGKVVGQPDMVRFGLEGFQLAVKQCFLPDGGSVESASYGMMTMGNIQNFPYMFRDYSDPENYVPPKNQKRLEHFNACRDTDYGLCWRALVLSLQGNLRHPPMADTHKITYINRNSGDLLALCLPNEFNLAFFKANNKGAISNGRNALFFGNRIDLENVREFSLPDIVFPYLLQGYFRYGDKGLEATAVLSATPWGGHHHHDCLNLVLWHQDELLNDLGYLWDHPDKMRTSGTMAHNLVMVEGNDQPDLTSGSKFTLFEVHGKIKVMRAASEVYGPDGIYERTLLQIDRGDQGFYWLDLFRANQGSFRDYVFHGVNNDYVITGAQFPDGRGKSAPDKKPGIPVLAKDRHSWEIVWKIQKDHEFAAIMPVVADEKFYMADEWGQRDGKNKDRGATLPYVFRRRSGVETSNFVTCFHSYFNGKRLVRDVLLEEKDGNLIVTVATEDGNDIIMFSNDGTLLDHGKLASDAKIAVFLALDSTGLPADAMMFGGKLLKAGGKSKTTPVNEYSGMVADAVRNGENSYFLLNGENVQNIDFNHRSIVIYAEDGTEHVYPVLKAEKAGASVKVSVMLDGYGFPAVKAQSWSLPALVSL